MPKVILCNEEGAKIGEEELEAAHSGEGKRHLAFIIVIRDSKGRVLIQKRSKNKRFPSYWEFPASHLFPGETWEEALRRTLKKELGIIDELKFRRLFYFNYKAKGEREEDVENEFCVVFSCDYDGEIRPNKEEIESFKFVDLDDVEEELKGEKISEWLRIPLKELKNYI